MTKLIVAFRNLETEPNETSDLKHTLKKTSFLECEGVFDEVVPAFSMDRGVVVFRVTQLRLCYFFYSFL